MSKKAIFVYFTLCFLLIFSPMTSNWVKAEENKMTADTVVEGKTLDDNQSLKSLDIEEDKVIEFEGVELEKVEEEEAETGSSIQSFEPAKEYSQDTGSISTASVSAASTSFTDVPSSYWAYINIQHLSSKQIINGYQTSNGSYYFNPDHKVTRAQAAKMIVEALGQTPAQVTGKRFTDVPSDYWAAGYIERAYQLGIFGGYADGSFGPSDTLKRSQMAKVIVEGLNFDYNGYVPASPVFSDVSTSYWAYEYIEKLHYNGVSNGNNYRFLPEDQITRAQFSAFLSRAIDEDYRLTVTGPVTSTGKVISSTSLNIRKAPTTSSSIIGSLKPGTMVNISEFSGYWAKINYNGIIGYVHKSYLKLYSSDSRYPLKDRIIVVDAGHGAQDPGAAKNGIYEKNIVLQVSKRVGEKLKAAGANVILTRETDKFLTLDERVKFTQSVYGELFVSVHVNAAGSTAAKGSEVFYDTSNNMNGAESKTLAWEIQKQLVAQADMYDRGIKDSGFYVIKYNQIPAVLVELGFLTNSEDRQKLTSSTYLEKYAEAIYQGIKNYYLK
ncbi:N-acetylmuramoyl-L-alanine amidase [Cytobacillus oceanisediminis]|uniref:N-acetylmuramoyl-L-alanine amidase n=1 Tax=Cytobacillus oceanisediminis TaxID=665099 RepID=UPI003736472D